MGALEAFFRQDTGQFDIEMLAVDLLRPQNSRVKIYFRSRKTSFASIKQAMTLNGRLNDNAALKGLQELGILWDTLFGVNSDEELPPVFTAQLVFCTMLILELAVRYPVSKPTYQFVTTRVVTKPLSRPLMNTYARMGRRKRSLAIPSSSSILCEYTKPVC